MLYENEYAAAETVWEGPAGTYDVTIGLRPEFDGECTYLFFVNGALRRLTVAPTTELPIAPPAPHTWTGIEIATGDTLRIVANNTTNGLVPEGAFAFTLQMEGYPDRRGGARLRGFTFNEADLAAFAAQPWVATATDGGIALPEDGPTTHSRFYGTFPRKIREYALDRQVISVEFAVRAGTSLPAQMLGLRNRGLLREGFWADVVIMDLERLQDRSTFFDPHQYSAGIDHVLVNGQFVVDGEGHPTGALPGVVITRDEGRSSVFDLE